MNKKELKNLKKIKKININILFILIIICALVFTVNMSRAKYYALFDMGTLKLSIISKTESLLNVRVKRVWSGSSSTQECSFSDTSVNQNRCAIMPILLLPGDSILIKKDSPWSLGYFYKISDDVSNNKEKYYIDSGWSNTWKNVTKDSEGNILIYVPNSPQGESTTENEYVYFVGNVKARINNLDKTIDEAMELLNLSNDEDVIRSIQNNIIIQRNGSENDYKFNQISYENINTSGLPEKYLGTKDLTITFNENISLKNLRVKIAENIIELNKSLNYTYDSETSTLILKQVNGDISILKKDNPINLIVYSSGTSGDNTAKQGDEVNAYTPIGTEIAIGDEHFYIISNEHGKMRAIAKYNLQVGVDYTKSGSLISGSEHTGTVGEQGNGIQNSEMQGWTGSTDRRGVVAYNNENINTILQAYNAYLDVKNLLIGLATYNDIKGLTGVSSQSEVNLLTTVSDNSHLEWICSSSYWLEDTVGNNVWRIASDGRLGTNEPTYKTGFGVRPVIEFDFEVDEKEEKEEIQIYGSGTSGDSSIKAGDKVTNNTPIGTEIVIKDEHFYIISNENNIVKALAKYNLQVGADYDKSGVLVAGSERTGTIGENEYGLQKSTMLGWRNKLERNGVLKYSDEVSTIATEYGEYLNVDGLTGKLAISEDIKNITGIDSGETEVNLSTANSQHYSWLCSSSYWLGDESTTNSKYVWRIATDGRFGLQDKTYVKGFGVRPLIEFAVSDN